MVKYRCYACGCIWNVEDPSTLKKTPNGMIYCPCCGAVLDPEQALYKK
ncbi:MAG: hypothetical protein PHW58_05335 [Candidatus Methanofastidiosa archaeon]|jgi:predicted  nucleic acid-binding Zn-ribbon protein|nr:hypothetical protein [Candidatus Methanofastidiosa archaeon]MDD4281627.1 hypothetical protein [Candidatus Methanofastidiosa archaeon]